MKAMVIDINRCNGCYNCQVACKDEHVTNDWTPIAKPQPNTGQFWMKVTDVVQGTVPKVRVRYMHDICQHCDDAPCIKACVTKAIYKREDGIVITDLNIAQKCTFCAHLLDDGWKEPRCVDACPTDALRFGEEEDLREYIDGSELLHPEYNARPRVYYKGLLNKFFIAGEVYDPQKDECLEGCAVTLTNADGLKAHLKTDNFGDFWFERQDPGVYSLLIENSGYLPREINDIDASKDINVGDIELSKKV
ncbi:MAG: carboxypeptidase regulatory-like domain-containing protein [Deltaproteobacteria bacterium]|nr:carboxypeptidase regulatory-like domain-containing protein [Deltaproteobacteria bacterium]